MNNTAVVIVGYSNHGKLAAHTIQEAGFVIEGYCDSLSYDHLNPLNLLHLGSESSFDWQVSHRFFVAIGDNNLRQRVYQYLILRATPLSHIAQIGSLQAGSTAFGMNTILMLGSTVQLNCHVGKSCIINTGASIDHDCSVGDFTHIGPNAVLTGSVKVGNCSFIGANATVLPNLEIGNNCTLGAGSVLTKNLPCGETWVGNPARPIRSKQLS